jgi:hypothetical protein
MFLFDILGQKLGAAPILSGKHDRPMMVPASLAFLVDKGCVVGLYHRQIFSFTIINNSRYFLY